MKRIASASVALAVLLAASPASAADKAVDRAKLDPSMEPCKDFYQYASGGWLAKNPIPPDRSSWGTGAEVADRTLGDLRAIAESAAAATDAPPASIRAKVGALYRSGMDTAKIEADGLKPLAPALAKIGAVKDAASLVATIAWLQRAGVGAGFVFAVNQDFKDSSVMQAWLYQGGLGLPDRDYYLSDDAKKKEIRSQYPPHVRSMLALAGDAAERTEAEAATVLALETRLARVSMTPVEQRDPNAISNRMDLASLSALAPQVPWADYFRAIGLSAPGAFNVGQPKFFAEFGKMVREIPLGDWKTYLRWQLLHAEASRLSTALVDEDFRFYGKTLVGTQELRPRWKRVLETTDNEIGEALGQLYVEKHFPPDAKRKARALVDHLMAALGERIGALDWIGAETRKAALAKLSTIMVKVGYPDRWRDYARLRLDAGSYAGNVMQAEEFETDRNLAKVGKPVDRGEWGISPATVDAYYNPSFNEIVFPAGILQPPLFDPAADDASNYGAIGAVIGHELTHGFDDEGHQFDAKGNLAPWWTPEDEKRYAARAEIVEKQFDAYVPVDDLHINGKLTLGENIADLGGVKIAYLALQKALAETPAPKATDGFTPDQRFFLSYGQSWRRNQRPEAVRLMLATDPHSPPRFRVNGPIANMPEFAKAFGCAAPAAGRAEIW
ncbi:MAG: M13 family metallopeptidase [Thermoanaerobaculia bacterium]